MPAVRRPSLVLLMAAMLVPGCASNPAPRGWLPSAQELPRFTRGAWIVIDLGRGAHAEGELIALATDGFQVLTADGLRFAGFTDARRVRLALYTADPKVMRLGTAGAVSTLTHGFFLPLTIWFWLAPLAGESRAPILHPARAGFEDLRKYARFPQGMPPGLDPAALGPLLP